MMPPSTSRLPSTSMWLSVSLSGGGGRMSGMAAIPADDHPAQRQFPHPISHPSTTNALQVMWLEGLIVLIVILLALGVGTCCMHMVDVPSRFAQPQVTRPHGD